MENFDCYCYQCFMLIDHHNIEYLLVIDREIDFNVDYGIVSPEIYHSEIMLFIYLFIYQVTLKYLLHFSSLK